MLDPLFLLIGLGGIALMFYAFSTMKVLSRNARLIGISILMAVLILLGNRLLSPDRRSLLPDNLLPRTTPEDTIPRDSLPYDNLPRLNPFERDPGPAARLQPGWQDAPYVILELILAELAGADNSSETPIIPTPSTPASPPASPAPSPLPASPAPALPSPSLSPAPASPSPSPTPPFDYSNPEFDNSPEQIPARPVDPSPQPRIVPPRRQLPPREPAPLPSRPVPAWW